MSEQDFYAAFTDRHRGPRDLIMGRLETDYLAFLQPLKQLFAKCPALDLGCGRGEWLELLTREGFQPHGIDLDQPMLADCRARGLSVAHQDATTAVASMPADSQALVSAFHLVEHIPFDDLQRLVRECLRVLKPGGLMILETPNPENILVSTSGFYLDPTHQRPLPLHLLAFLAEHTGFARIKVLRLHEGPVSATLSLMDVLNGASPDYAIVAQKPCDPSVMALTAAPFALERGRLLDGLTAQYDARLAHADNRINESGAQLVQTKAQLAETKAQLIETNARLYHAELRLLQGEDIMARAFARIDQFEQRIAQAEARAANAEAELRALYNSRSWRITSPMRAVGSLARKLVFGSIRWAVRNPLIKYPVKSVVARFPRLESRLRHLAGRALHGTAARAADVTGELPLPPRVQEIHDQLTKALERRNGGQG